MKLSGKILFEIDSIMKGASSSSKSSSELEIPKLELGFTCYPECSEEGCDSGFAIGNTGVNKPTPHDIIFAPSEIKSDFLYTWTLDWTSPFRVGNFLYLTSPSIRYVFVYNEDYSMSKTMAEKIYNLFLDNEFITVDLYSEEELMDDFEATNHKHVRFVFFYTFEDDLDLDIGKSDFDLVIFSDPNPNFNGHVLFLSEDMAAETGDFDDSVGYFGKESMVGAIFSENQDFFVCNMHKAFNSLERIFGIYKIKALYLKTQAGACGGIYENFAAFPLPENFQYPSSFEEGDYEKISSLLKSMSSSAEKANKNAIFNSCPRLY